MINLEETVEGWIGESETEQEILDFVRITPETVISQLAGTGNVMVFDDEETALHDLGTPVRKVRITLKLSAEMKEIREY